MGLVRRSVAVVGAGPAGALIGALLSSRGYTVDLYDKDGRYEKPCGMGIPAPRSGAWWGPANEVWGILVNYGLMRYVVNEITGFEVLVGMDEPKRIVYDAGTVFGYIVNKPDLVEGLRELSDSFYEERTVPEKLVGDYDIVIDARGPFIDDGVRRMAVVQGFATTSNKSLNRHRLVFHITGNVFGYWWAFPVGNDYWDIGAGCLGCSGKQLMEEYKLLRDLHGFSEAERPRGGAILAEMPKTDIVRLEALTPIIRVGLTPIIRVGEAAGHVMYHTGEGIRPAFLSAWTVFNAVHQSLPYPMHMKLFIEKSVKRSKIHRDSIKSLHIVELLEILYRKGILVKAAGKMSARMWLRLFNARVEGVSAIARIARAILRIR